MKRLRDSVFLVVFGMVLFWVIGPLALLLGVLIYTVLFFAETILEARHKEETHATLA
jgi:hypothetical protein